MYTSSVATYNISTRFTWIGLHPFHSESIPTATVPRLTNQSSGQAHSLFHHKCGQNHAMH